MPRDAAPAQGRDDRPAVPPQGRAGALPLRGRSFAGGAIVALALAILVGLGTWQVERLAWKEGVIARVAARAGGPAAPLDPALLAPGGHDPARDEYRPVALRGVFDHAREARAFVPSAPGSDDGTGRAAAGAGYLVLTPLRLAGGAGTVIVNRGFVPLERADPASRAAGQVAGEVTVEGLLRAPERRTAFSGADDPAGNVWQVRDPAAIAAAYGLGPVAPFLVDQRAPVPPGGLPRPGATRLTIPNNHLAYALTWYGLAAALLGVLLARALTARAARRRGAAPGG